MGATGNHVLIIEDEALAALDLEAQLADLGFTSFDVAVCERDALAFARERRPDLITADYRIVGGTGLAAFTAIVAELGKIPVVYVTGNPAQVAGLGAPVVEKPIFPAVLARACSSACGTA